MHRPPNIEASAIICAPFLLWMQRRGVPTGLAVLAVVIILKAIFSLKTFDLVYMLTNGGPGDATQTLSHYVYFNGFKYANIGYSAAVAWLMVIPMLVLTYAYTKLVFARESAH